MRMRILVLGWFGYGESSGGMEVHIREICKNLSGTDILLAVPKNMRPKIENSRMKIIGVPCKTKASSTEKMMKNVSGYNRNILNALGKNRPEFDIVHSHDWLSVAAAKELKKRLKKPWVHTVHSLEHIRAGEETDSKISAIEKEGIMRADKLITVSNLMKKEIIKKYKVPAKKISVIKNYLGAVSAKEPAGKEKREKRTVLFVGRLSLQKGVETLISAFPDVIRAFPDATLVVAGGGNLEKSLVLLAKIKGIEKSVAFPGRVEGNKIKRFYRSASVFVSPSYFEPFGITLLEAAHFGAPIIATQTTGALEIFGKNSIIRVAPYNRAELAKKIIRLLKNKSERARLAKAAKNDLIKTDGWKKIAEETKKTYENLPANYIKTRK